MIGKTCPVIEGLRRPVDNDGDPLIAKLMTQSILDDRLVQRVDDEMSKLKLPTPASNRK